MNKTTTAKTTAALVIGPEQLPYTVPAGTVVTVTGDLEGRDIVYISSNRRGGAVYTKYLKAV